MPTYTYECKSCGYKFEKFQSITDQPEKKCPECGKSVRKLISAGAGLIFKGKGFYQTDYKSCPVKKEVSKDKADKKPDCNNCSCSGK